MALSFRPLLLLLLTKCFFTPSIATLQAVRFSRTGAVTVDTACRLSVFTPYGNQISVKKACTIQCMETTDCRLFCIGVDGKACDLYSSFAAVRFTGHSSGQPYSACYTSWGDPRDIIKTDTPMTSTSIYSAAYDHLNARDGYAECGECTYFCTKLLANSHAQFDLGAVMRVKSVIVQGSLSNYFNNIVIYLGNTTTFNNHPVYATQPGEGGLYTTSVLSGKQTISGRYLTIYSPDDVYLGFCELQVNRL